MVLSEEEKKERQRISAKKYYEKNKEHIREKQKEYRQTSNGKESKTITDWKRQGLVSTDYNLLYDNYLKSTNCEECDIEYGKFGDGSGTFKCMDHNHETGLFRNYLCCMCNFKRR